MSDGRMKVGEAVLVVADLQKEIAELRKLAKQLESALRCECLYSSHLSKYTRETLDAVEKFKL